MPTTYLYLHGRSHVRHLAALTNLRPRARPPRATPKLPARPSVAVRGSPSHSARGRSPSIACFAVLVSIFRETFSVVFGSNEDEMALFAIMIGLIIPDVKLPLYGGDRAWFPPSPFLPFGGGGGCPR